MKYFTRVRPPESSPETPGRAIAETLALVAEPLREVDESIRAQAEAFDPAVAPYASYALASSGKRLRPAMALLAGGATGGLTPEHTRLAVIVEMIHLATLVHDDIMDGADTRRDQPTPNARWGNAITVLLGDCLFAHALDLASQFDEAQISRKIARAANAVCTGEIIQTQRRFDLNLSHEDYFSIIEKKTAALFAVAAELGAVLNHAEPAAVAAMQSFGLRLGTAYQVYDDCLDLAGDEEVAGKTLGTDLRKGKLTLPILNLLKAASPADLAVYSQMILRAEEPEAVALTAAARRSGALGEAVRTGVDLVLGARAELSVLPETPHRAALQSLALRIAEQIGRFETGGK